MPDAHSEGFVHGFPGKPVPTPPVPAPPNVFVFGNPGIVSFKFTRSGLMVLSISQESNAINKPYNACVMRSLPSPLAKIDSENAHSIPPITI